MVPTGARTEARTIRLLKKHLTVKDGEWNGRQGLTEAWTKYALARGNLEQGTMCATDDPAVVTVQKLILFPGHTRVFIVRAIVAPAIEHIALPHDKHRVAPLA